MRDLETRGVFALNSSPIPTLARAAAGDAGIARKGQLYVIEGLGDGAERTFVSGL